MTAPTDRQIEAAAIRWCGEKDRETFPEDIEYFRNNWSALPGLRAYVDREIADDAALTPAWENYVQRRWGGWTKYAAVHTQSSGKADREAFEAGWRANQTIRHDVREALGLDTGSDAERNLSGLHADIKDSDSVGASTLMRVMGQIAKVRRLVSK